MQLGTLLWLLLAQAIGGSMPALTKLALGGLGPFGLVVVRQVLGTLFLLLLARWISGPLPSGLLRNLSRGDRRLVLLLAFAGFALPQILNAIGLTLSTATNGALLSPLEPIGILIGGAFLLGERLTPHRVVAMTLGIAGATLIVLQGGFDPSAGDLRGDALMAAGHLAWAIYTLAAKPLLVRHDPLRVALLASALSPIPLLPLAVAEPVDLERLLPALGWIGLLAFLGTAVGTLAWNRALRELSAGTVAVFVFVQPLVGLGIGTLLLDEPAGRLALAGALLIVVGVTLAGLRGEAREGPR